MSIERPDLSDVSPEIIAYIEALEEEIEHTRTRQRSDKRNDTPIEPSEPPTTLNVVTVSAGGFIKRTPRHLYQRQRRGGMGVFDLDVTADDTPAYLAVSDESSSILIITSNARAFRFDLDLLPESQVHSRGQALTTRLSLQANESLACVLPAEMENYLVLATERGQVRRFVGHNFGTSMRPGTVLYDVRQVGIPVAACWSAGDGDLFITSRLGRAIRFSEQQVPVRGCLGMRLDRDDQVVGITTVQESSQVILIGADGKGTVRQMNGFRSNKSPGANGKSAMKTDMLIGAVRVDEQDDVFVISKLGKIIRFSAEDVPAKTGVVQGVNCMELRSDEVVAFTTTTTMGVPYV